MLGVHPSKKKTIEHHQGPLLIIAGPGSVKNSTLVERIINLIHVHSAKPEQLLVVTFTKLSLVADIARYINKPYLEIEKINAATEEGFDGILELVNKFNEVLYDQVIPRLFKAMYDIESESVTEEFEVDLIK